ncbi:MAG: MarR family winged helix-turn-helix transcriptional regulator [Ignisphaera sp.]
MDFIYVVKVLTLLYRAEEVGRTLTTTDVIIEGGIPSSTFHTSIKPLMEEAGLIKVEPNPEARAMVVKITEKGRELAKCLKCVSDFLD